MMRFAQNMRGIAALLLILILGGMFFIPRQNAEASVPTNCSYIDFNCIKEGVLDPTARAVMKKMIRELRAATINWIITGDFEIKKPFFVTSFIADPQRIADNAARTFLSGLTGINFCSFHPNLRSIQQFIIPLDFSQFLACSADLERGGRLSKGWGGVLASNQASNNISSILYNLKKEEERSVQRSMSAFIEEVRSGAGFLGQRDPKTGKINTPGNLIAETIIGSQNSEMFGQEVNQEIFSAIVDVIDTAIGKTIQDGLLK
jgi:hypothetical protein